MPKRNAVLSKAQLQGAHQTLSRIADEMGQPIIWDGFLPVPQYRLGGAFGRTRDATLHGRLVWQRNAMSRPSRAESRIAKHTSIVAVPHSPS